MGDKDRNIIISEDTRAVIGPEIVDFLEEQANQGLTVPEAIVSRADYDGFFLTPDYFSDKAHINRIFSNMDFPQESQRREFREIIEQAAQTDNDAVHLNTAVLRRRANNEPHADDGRPEDFTVATVMNVTSVPDLVFSATEIPRENMSPVVSDISISDLQTYAVFHEVGHANHGLVGEEGEFEAEVIANNLYAQAFNQGLVTDPRVPEAFSEFRALGTFHKSEVATGYPLNGILTPENETVTPEPIESENVSLMVNDLYVQVAEPYENARHQTVALSYFNEDDLREFLSPEQMTELNGLLAEHRDPDANRVETLGKMETFISGVTIPEEYQEYYRAEVNLQLRHEGDELVNGELVGRDDNGIRIMQGGQPELLYLAVRENLIAGEYDEDPELKNLATNYVLGAERLAPDHYNVANHGQTYEQYLKAQGTPDVFGYDPNFNPPEADQTSEPAQKPFIGV